MIKDAETFAAEDKVIKERVEAKNDFESYAYSLKNQLGDKEKLGGKLSDDDKTKVEDSVNESIKWLEGNAETAEVSEIQAKKKELEEQVQPIIAKLYAGAQGQPGADGDAVPPTDSEFTKEEL